MPTFGSTSRMRLAELDPRLKRVMEEAIKYYDFTVLCGHRNQEDQEAAYRAGHSRVLWPNSRHNAVPARAVDIAPWKPGIDWNDIPEFCYMAGVVMSVAWAMGVNLLWGGRWQKLKDYPHFELVDEGYVEG
jgi:peptidoglycan L-alanyl-D-glutamate endopeptidase CwlK